jgi:hypothetical protein
MAAKHDCIATSCFFEHYNQIAHAAALLHFVTLRYVTCSTQQGVGTPLGANERLIGGRALKELIKIN